jgi:hypothetical protein
MECRPRGGALRTRDWGHGPLLQSISGQAAFERAKRCDRRGRTAPASTLTQCGMGDASCRSRTMFAERLALRSDARLPTQRRHTVIRVFRRERSPHEGTVAAAAPCSQEPGGVTGRLGRRLKEVNGSRTDPSHDRGDQRARSVSGESGRCRSGKPGWCSIESAAKRRALASACSERFRVSPGAVGRGKPRAVPHRLGGEGKAEARGQLRRRESGGAWPAAAKGKRRRVASVRRRPDAVV